MSEHQAGQIIDQAQENPNTTEEIHQPAQGDDGHAPRPYRGNRGGYHRGGGRGGRFSGRGGRYVPRGSGRGAPQQGKKWVPKGQAQNVQNEDQEQDKQASHQQDGGEQKQPHHYKKQQGYGGKEGHSGKPSYKKKGEDHVRPQQQHPNPSSQFQNYWRYYNEERKAPVHLIKKEDMKWDSDIPELPKNKPKMPVDEEYEKRKQVIEKEISAVQDKIDQVIQNKKSLRQGYRIQTQNQSDTKEMKQTKQLINVLNEEKKQLHNKQKQEKDELTLIKNKLADLHSAKDILPKQIQKYWQHTEAEKRLNQLENMLETGSLGKLEEEKSINEVELLKKYLPQLKKISAAPQEIKKQAELRDEKKKVLDEFWKKIKQIKDQTDVLNDKLNHMYEKQDGKGEKLKQEEQMEKMSQQIQDLKKQKSEFIHKKRKVDDDFYGDWIEYQNDQILYNALSRLHKVKAAINRRKQYTEQQEKQIMEKQFENPHQDQIDSCDQLIALLEQEIYMNKQTSGNQQGKASEQSKAPILAPKGTTQIKSKQQRMEQDFELLQPTKLPGGKNKKKNKKYQATAPGLSHQSSSSTSNKKREYNLLVQFGKLDIEKPENPQQYKEKLEQIKERRDVLIEKGQNEIKNIREKQIAAFRERRQEQEKLRQKGEFVPNKYRGGRGGKFRDGNSRGGGNYGRGQKYRNDDGFNNDNDDQEGGRGSGGYKRGKQGGYGRGGNKYEGKKKFNRYDDEDEEDDQDDYSHRKPQKKEVKGQKEYVTPAEQTGMEWPELK